MTLCPTFPYHSRNVGHRQRRVTRHSALHELGYDLDATIHADTPARLKAVGNPLRALILDLVLERAMTVTELAARVRKPRGTVAHHVDVLVDAGLLKVTATRRVRAIDERFYGRTAHTIVFPDAATDGDLPFVADARAEADLSDSPPAPADSRCAMPEFRPSSPTSSRRG